jgi:site-specific recombinase XerD
MSEASMYRVVADYLARLPGAVKDGACLLQHPFAARYHRYVTSRCRVDIRMVRELLDQRHVTTTRIYDSGGARSKRAPHMTFQSDLLLQFFRNADHFFSGSA